MAQDFEHGGVDAPDDPHGPLDEEDIASALARIDFEAHASPPELEHEDRLELKELSGMILDLDEELNEQLESTSPAIDPFAASGLFVLTPEMRRQAEASAPRAPVSPSALDLIPPAAVLSEGEEDVLELDPSALKERGGGGGGGGGGTPPPLPQGVVAAQKKAAASKALSAGVALDAAGGNIELAEPWGRFSAQMRLETLQEPDARRRASYLSLFGSLLRLHGPAGRRAASQLEQRAEPALSASRLASLHRLEAELEATPSAFLAATRRLFSHEIYATSSIEGVEERTSSLLVAKLMRDLIAQSEESAELIDALRDRHDVLALAALALLAHRRGASLEASSFWAQCARQLEGHGAETIKTLSVYTTLRRHDDRGGEPSAEALDPERDAAHASRLVWMHRRRVARAQGQPLREAYLIERSLELEHEGVHPEIAALFDRLASLRHDLARGDEEAASSLLAIEAAHAAALAAPEQLYPWTVLERFATEIADSALLIEALTAQIRLLEDRPRRALKRVQLARALAARDGAVGASALAALELALEEAPESLPVLLTLGHLRIARRDWEGVLALRHAPSVRESPSLAASWRRADLLERERGDLREILALYRSARRDRPDSPHLFFCLERALAKLGQWRALQTLLETTEATQPELAALLAENGYALSQRALAARLYLPELHRPEPEALARHLLAAPPHAPLDEAAHWHLVARLLAGGDLHRALSLTERALEETGPLKESQDAADLAPRRARALFWLVYIRGWHQGDAEAIRGPLRELLGLVRGPLATRFVLHSMIRLNDAAVIADALLEQGASSHAPRIVEALLPSDLGPSIMASIPSAVWLAMEFAARSGDAALWHRARSRALDAVSEEDGEALAHTLLRLALRARDWASCAEALGALSALHGAFTPQLVRLLNVLAPSPLDPSALPPLAPDPRADPLHRLIDAEAIWRGGRFAALDGELKALSDVAARFGDEASCATLVLIRALMLDLALERYEPMREAISRWSERGGEGAEESELFILLALWQRAARLTSHHEEIAGVSTLLEELFDAASLKLLDDEHILLAPGGAATAAERLAWYEQARQRGATPNVARYCAVRAAMIQALDGAPGEGGPLEERCQEDELIGVIGVLSGRLGAVMRRDALVAMSDRPRRGSMTNAWRFVRALLSELELGLEPLDALHRLSGAPSALQDEAWTAELEALIARSSGERELASPCLEALIDYRGPVEAAHAHTELALLGGRDQDLIFLASEHDLSALCELEHRAALAQRDWRPAENLEIAAASLGQDRRHAPARASVDQLLEFLRALSPELLASPWADVHALEHELSRLKFEGEALEALTEVARACRRDDGPSLELLYFLAARLERAGRGEVAIELLPERVGGEAEQEEASLSEPTLIEMAWPWLSYAIAPRDDTTQIGAWRLALWRERARRARRDDLRGELLYEVARLLELHGEADQAHQVYAESHALSPRFLPTQVARARHLIARKDFAALCAQWETALAQLEPGSEEAHGLAFRLAFVIERELEPSTQNLERALTLYRRSLSSSRSDFAALEAIARLAARAGRFELAVEHLEMLLPSCADRGALLTLHLRLAELYEQELMRPERALEHFAAAHALDSSSYVALLGVARTDQSEQRARALGALAARLQVASLEEAERLSDHVLLLCVESASAEHLMRAHFPAHTLWRLTQLTDALERGELHEEALGVLSRCQLSPALSELFAQLEVSALLPSQRSAREAHHVALMRSRPVSQGLWLLCLAAAWREGDAGRVAELCELTLTHQARTPLEWGCEATRVAMMALWQGDAAGALRWCERALERAPRLLAAIKLAHLSAERASEWASAARWLEREAELSTAPEVVTESHLRAGEIQRLHLGDLDAAISQLALVFKASPGTRGRLRPAQSDAPASASH